jgi:hypothetical protein
MFHLQSEPNPPYITPWSSLLSNESIYTTALLVTSILSVVEAVIMKSSALVTGVGLLLIARTVANKDAITLQTRGNSWINEAVATLVLPEDRRHRSVECNYDERLPGRFPTRCLVKLAGVRPGYKLSFAVLYS